MYGRYKKSGYSAYKAGYAAAMRKKKSYGKKRSGYSNYGRRKRSW